MDTAEYSDYTDDCFSWTNIWRRKGGGIVVELCSRMQGEVCGQQYLVPAELIDFDLADLDEMWNDYITNREYLVERLIGDPSVRMLRRGVIVR